MLRKCNVSIKAEGTFSNSKPCRSQSGYTQGKNIQEYGYCSHSKSLSPAPNEAGMRLHRSDFHKLAPFTEQAITTIRPKCEPQL